MLPRGVRFIQHATDWTLATEGEDTDTDADADVSDRTQAEPRARDEHQWAGTRTQWTQLPPYVWAHAPVPDASSPMTKPR